MNDTLISIIVPIYNGEKYLPECIESVLLQTHTNLELLLIDDGSTDGSAAICEKYREIDSRIRVTHKGNGGVSSARNAGLGMMNGRYVMFLDADDTIVCDCCQALLEKIKQYDADMVCARMLYEEWDTNGEIIWRGEQVLEAALKELPFADSSCAKLFRSDLIGDTRFSEDIRVNEDGLFVFELLCKKPVAVCIEKEVYFYRINPESASRAKFSEKYFDIIRVADIKAERIAAQFPSLKRFADNMELRARMNLLRVLAVRTKGGYRDVERELIQYVRENRGAYISASKRGDRWLFTITHGLYYVFKFAVRMRHAQRKIFEKNVRNTVSIEEIVPKEQ